MVNERQLRILFVPNSEDLAGVWRKRNSDGRYYFYLPDSTCVSKGLGQRSG